MALHLIYISAYPILAGWLLLPVCVLLWQLRAEPWVGRYITWSDGQWYLGAENNLALVELAPGSVRLPWLIKLGFDGFFGAGRQTILLFADSASARELRDLRRRLILQG